MAFSHVSRTIRDVTGKTFARKFITLGKVIQYWAEAVGPDIAAKAYPVGMSVRKNPKTGKEKKTGTMPNRDLVATLELAASSSEATLIHYQKKIILDRLALLIGADMIVDLKIVHNATPALTRMDLQENIRPFPLTDAQKHCLSPEQLGTDRITDDELRIALERLGQYIVTRNNNQNL